MGFDLFSLRRTVALLQRLCELLKGSQHDREHGHLSQNAPVLSLLKVSVKKLNGEMLLLDASTKPSQTF